MFKVGGQLGLVDGHDVAIGEDSARGICLSHGVILDTGEDEKCVSSIYERSELAAA